MRLRGQALTPDPLTSCHIRARKIEDEPNAAQKCRIEVLAHVRREDRQTSKRLHALKEVGDLDVRIAVVRVLHVAALSQERFGFVDEDG